MKYAYIIGALVVVGLIGGLLLTGKADNPFKNKDTASTTQDATAVVATFTMNGGENTITRGQLDAQIQTLANNPQIQVPDQSNTEARTTFERLVLTQMVRDALLFDEAQKQGFTADTAAVDAELAKISGQYPDATAFQAALAAASVSEDTLRTNLAHQLILNQYSAKIAADQGITVTPEEVRTFFDEQVAPEASTTPFEEVSEKIQEYLTQQKTGAAVATVVESLYTAANTQIRI